MIGKRRAYARYACLVLELSHSHFAQEMCCPSSAVGKLRYLNI